MGELLKTWSKTAFFCIPMLTACGQLANNPLHSCYEELPERWVVCDRDRNFTLWFPREIWESDWKTRNIDLSIYHSPFTENELREYEDHSMVNPLLADCENLGVSEPIIEEDLERDMRTIRGKVTEFYDGSTFPHCYTQSIYPEKKIDPYTTSYVLCSERGNAKVMICIQQVTDDPALANQIFATFRWTE